MNTYKDELWLYHHGVKGQQWGIRRGPPYPIEDTVLKKGTRLNTVSNYKHGKKGRWVYTYNPNDEWDSKVYRGPFAQYSKSRSVDKGKLAAQIAARALITPVAPVALLLPYKKTPRKFIYDRELETTEDLKLANSKQRTKEFVDLYKTDPEKYKQDLQKIQNALLRAGFNGELVGIKNEDLYKQVKSDLKAKKDIKVAKFLLDHGMKDADKFELTKDYSKVMREKYDGMVDDHNVKVYNDAHDPVILFLDKYKNVPVKELGVRKVRQEEIMQNIVDVRDELTKKGKTLLY